MVIQHNLAGLNSKRNQRINESKLRKNLEKLSSGYKVNRAGDGAAELAMSERLRFLINGVEQAQHNIGDAINFIQIAEGAMQEVHTILNRMYECGMASSNEIYDETGREALQAEVAELKEEVERIAEETEYYYIPLLEGDDPVKDTQFQIGPAEEDIIEINLPDLTNELETLGFDEVDVSDQQLAHESLDKIKDAINYVSQERGRMGAYQKNLEHAERELSIRVENLSASESRIRDTDMAEEITNYTKNNVLLQAAQSMMTQANALPETVMNLLQ